MKKLLKFTALLAVLGMTLAFAGCKNPASEAPKPAVEETPAATPETPAQDPAADSSSSNPQESTEETIPEELKRPLTFEAIKDGEIFITSPWSTLKYSIDGGELQAVQAELDQYGDLTASIPVQEGQKVSFYADGSENDFNRQDEYSLNFGCHEDEAEPYFYVYGNVMSLLDSVNYSTKKDIDNDFALAYLFDDGYVRLINHPQKNIILPATNLKPYCYAGMFCGCESMERAPLLPATNLAEGCYAEMFQDCHALIEAPELPATTLAKGCYFEMFDSCKSLTRAPVLPAQTLVESCYEGMFEWCDKIAYVKCLATNIEAKDCTADWLWNVPAGGSFVKANGVKWPRNKNGIPADWTIDGASKYSITIENSVNGSLTSDKESAEEGVTITLTINPMEGYLTDSVTVTGADNNSLDTVSNGNNITFIMPAANVTVTATFKVDTSKSYNISVTGGAAIAYSNGIISGQAGSEYGLKAIIPAGKKFVNWTTTTQGLTINDVNSSETTFVMPPRAVNITANFQNIVYTITPATPDHGSFTSNKTSAYYGDKVTLTITPDLDYEFNAISVNGVSNFEENDNTISFNMPAENVNISVSFKEILYGTKEKADEVGDIVFKNGRALPKTEWEKRELTDREKANAMAIAGYKNTRNGSVLYVGLNQEYLNLCSEDSQGFNNTSAFSTITQEGWIDSGIATYEAILNANGKNIITDYNENPDNYPAFKWAFNYLGKERDHWYIPTLNELRAIYSNIDVIKAATEKLGSQYSDILAQDKDKEYTSVTLYSGDDTETYFKDFNNGSENSHSKKDMYPVLVVKEVW